ncbi:MAG: insulinase family protein [Chitinivibrionales bacterium]|nr:insulinase family protein [Chitinivibrionales bacterium]
MRTVIKIIAFLTFCTAVSGAANISVPVHYDSLANGLKIMVVPDTQVAVVSCRLYYFVGSMYEGPGTSGLSHMYEHMMFKGTRTLGTKSYKKEVPIMNTIDSLDAKIQRLREQGASESDEKIIALRKQIFELLEKQRKYMKKDEIWELYKNNGGTHLNAWTGDDMTGYIVTLPENKVDLFYWIESDRMNNPVLREFYSERDVVTEERRMRYENRPAGKYYERLFALFYKAHPYRIPTIGWMSDIRSYTREKLREHVARYYTPDNALIVLVGKIEPEKAVKDIKRYFGHIPPAAEPKEDVVTREPDPVGQTRFTLHDNASPQMDMFFHTPGYPNQDLYVLDVVEGILSGRSGRLYERLVDKEKLCTNAGASNRTKLHNGYFHVWATLKDTTDPAEVEKIIIEEIERLTEKPPIPKEMERNKNNIRMSFVKQINSLEGLSDLLAAFERIGSWEDLIEYPDKIAEISPDQVAPVVTRYLKPDLSTIGMLLKPQKSEKTADNEQK